MVYCTGLACEPHAVFRSRAGTVWIQPGFRLAAHFGRRGISHRLTEELAPRYDICRKRKRALIPARCYRESVPDWSHLVRNHVFGGRYTCGKRFSFINRINCFDSSGIDSNLGTMPCAAVTDSCQPSISYVLTNVYVTRDLRYAQDTTCLERLFLSLIDIVVLNLPKMTERSTIFKEYSCKQKKTILSYMYF